MFGQFAKELFLQEGLTVQILFKTYIIIMTTTFLFKLIINR